jgi:hypothetical protein
LFIWVLAFQSLCSQSLSGTQGLLYIWNLFPFAIVGQGTICVIQTKYPSPSKEIPSPKHWLEFRTKGKHIQAFRRKSKLPGAWSCLLTQVYTHTHTHKFSRCCLHFTLRNPSPAALLCLFIHSYPSCYECVVHLLIVICVFSLLLPYKYIQI